MIDVRITCSYTTKDGDGSVDAVVPEVDDSICQMMESIGAEWYEQSVSIKGTERKRGISFILGVQ